MSLAESNKTALNNAAKRILETAFKVGIFEGTGNGSYWNNVTTDANKMVT